MKKLKILKEKFIYSNYFTFDNRENTKIKLDRKKLFVILNKNNNTKSDLNGLVKNLNSMVFQKWLSYTKDQNDEVPVSLVIANSKETDGNLQIAQKEMHYLVNGHGQEMVLSQREGDRLTHKVASFKVLKAS